MEHYTIQTLLWLVILTALSKAIEITQEMNANHHIGHLLVILLFVTKAPDLRKKENVIGKRKSLTIKPKLSKFNVLLVVLLNYTSNIIFYTNNNADISILRQKTRFLLNLYSHSGVVNDTTLN